MSDLGTTDEVLEFAIDRELEANQFYLVLANQMADERMRRLFESLAAEELEHKAKLELELMKEGRVTSLAKGASGFGISDLGDNDSEANLEMSYKEALILGTQKEESSFRLYVELSAMVRDINVRETLMSLIQEEVKHKLRFEDEYNKLMTR